ncbi:methyltransferase family protein [Sinobacterium caligoides]|uniref:Methyltransferase family protein n=1 Tax=Sinobacterium caligoides TaxID=933926 RepID=A0A3N2DDV1_9GAMM|nr:class I SAM-dependent methyltransferase [Sinobacterium caligoides]ROR97907.1 methyltransferase family protein [Sinobacterium caligoides]
MDILKHNRAAWNKESSEDGEWSRPVSGDTIRSAREGDWNVILTPLRTVPKSWFGCLQGKSVLCLASAGGQQAPVLAAAGAKVTSFDLSDVQLEKDRIVAERHNLDLQCIRGDMADLSELPDESFDLIFHAVSNIFVPDVEAVWRECYRVLKPKGELLAGFMNPSFFLFDHDQSIKDKIIEVKHKLPYAQPDHLDSEAIQELESNGRAVEFSHTLETQLGGQLKAGFMIADLYEDYWTDEIPFNAFSPSCIATRATKR